MGNFFKLAKRFGGFEDLEVPKLEQKKEKSVFLNQFFVSDSFVAKSLSFFFGISFLCSYKILKCLGFLVSTRFFLFLRRFVLSGFNFEKRVVLGKLLQRRIFRKFRRENKFSGYRFVRRLQGYSVKGQRTHSNHKTSKKKVWAFWLVRK